MCNILVLSFLGFKDARDDINRHDKADDAQRIDDKRRYKDRQHPALHPADLDLAIDLQLLGTLDVRRG